MSKTFAGKNEYPLEWPDHIPRTPEKDRQKSRFKVTLHQAMENVKHELELFAKDSGTEIHNIRFSSNVTLGEFHPDDPGVCVYFTWDGMDLCVPIDRYDKVRCNVQAIYHCLDADRTKMRHGGVEFVKSEKRGDNMLRLPGRSDWREILELKGVDDLTMQKVKEARNRLAKQHHSDRGGSDETMKKINQAFEAAKRYVRSN